MSALELRQAMIDAKKQFGRGEITIDELYVAVDAYIAALVAFKKRTKSKIPIPSRGYVLRAIS